MVDFYASHNTLPLTQCHRYCSKHLLFHCSVTKDFCAQSSLATSISIHMVIVWLGSKALCGLSYSSCPPARFSWESGWVRQLQVMQRRSERLCVAFSFKTPGFIRCLRPRLELRTQQRSVIMAGYQLKQNKVHLKRSTVLLRMRTEFQQWN